MHIKTKMNLYADKDKFTTDNMNLLSKNMHNLTISELVK